MAPSHLLILLYAGFVAVVALFSASETALFTLRWWRRRALRRERGLAPLLQQLEESPARLLFALLIGSEAASIGAAMTADAMRQSFFLPGSVYGFVLAVLAAGLLGAVLGEILPKITAANRPEQVARLLAWPLRGWLVIASPLTRLFAAATPEDKEESAKDLNAIIAHAQAEGNLNAQEARLLRGLNSLGQLSVASVMTPHPDVDGLDVGATLEAAQTEFKKTGFTRLVLFDEVEDAWPGYLHAADLLRDPSAFSSAGAPEGGLRALQRDAPLVPATTTVRQGLQALIHARSHLAFVVSETGQYIGLFTLEDGWRAALGESRHVLKPIGAGLWLCGGDQPLDELPLPVTVEEFDAPPLTVGGLLAVLSGDLPAVGQSFERDGLRFTVESVRGRRAGRIRVEKIEA